MKSIKEQLLRIHQIDRDRPRSTWLFWGLASQGWLRRMSFKS